MVPNKWDCTSSAKDTALIKNDRLETSCSSLRAIAATHRAAQARKSPYGRAVAFSPRTTVGVQNASPRPMIEAQFPNGPLRTRHMTNSANDIGKELKSLRDVSPEPNRAAQIHPTAK